MDNRTRENEFKSGSIKCFSFQLEPNNKIKVIIEIVKAKLCYLCLILHTDCKEGNSICDERFDIETQKKLITMIALIFLLC